MRIFFSGIGGVGIGPLALIAKDMGHDVLGSDINGSRYTTLMQQRGVPVLLGQDGSQIELANNEKPIDWFVYTSSLPADHPELTFAKNRHIRTSKRDGLLNELIKKKDLKLIAVAGTHGKTTTTGMLVWLFEQSGLPASYSVGSDLSFGPSGQYEAGSQYFIYEADEYDRNFLHFQPYLAVIPSIDYDHHDIFTSEDDYRQAFRQFIQASHCTYIWQVDADYLDMTTGGNLHILKSHEDSSAIKLAGEQNRRNAFLSLQAFKSIQPKLDAAKIISVLSKFPGTGRRFEAIAPNIYSDYAHHPAEIKATIAQARELNKNVVAVYQPHQNSRQHEIKELYGDAFVGAQAIYWLPTYLSRENPKLDVLQPGQLVENLSNRQAAQLADMDKRLKEAIKKHASEGSLVLLMSAGSLDEWARRELA